MVLPASVPVKCITAVIVVRWTIFGSRFLVSNNRVNEVCMFMREGERGWERRHCQ